ncbi:MAG: hypothetical protein AB7E63_13200 [Parachlamydia sp.]|jgi:hypothetical protein|uniref:hypothetical protein n=2 Tax=Parachlamydiaceae TaxID=92713 RepID=UPI0024E1B3C1|nr:hypothetical protein [Parachlamydia acanthamoebae]
MEKPANNPIVISGPPDFEFNMKVFLRIFIVLVALVQPGHAFDKVIIWGHKLHSHTHSYVHNGFYRAFQFLGYPTYWFDDQDYVEDFDFSNSLFLTEGQVDHNIPLREDCQYILHYCRSPKYQSLIEKGNCIILQVYNHGLYIYDEVGNPILESVPNPDTLIQVEPFVYCDPQGKRVYMPWATDLLPYEIDDVKESLKTVVKEPSVYWVGTYSGGLFGNILEIGPFEKACHMNNINFIHKNPWTPKRGISMQENCELIKRSYMAPAIVGTWQNEKGYIPCRIFKNISYGQMGITNSKTIYDLFEGKIVYNPNTFQLFYDAEKRIKEMKLEELYELMDFVKTKHTYLNRIQVLVEFSNYIKANTKS